MSSQFSVRIRGVGPLYIATEQNSREPRHVSHSWIIELAHPYRKGHGVRFRIGHRALQIGVCHKNPEVTEERLVEHLDWRWVPYNPQEVRDAIDALDPLDQGKHAWIGEEQVREAEPLDLGDDRVVGGRDVS